MTLIFYILMAVVGLALLPSAIESAALLIHGVAIVISRTILYVAIAGVVALGFMTFDRVTRDDRAHAPTGIETRGASRASNTPCARSRGVVQCAPRSEGGSRRSRPYVHTV